MLEALGKQVIIVADKAEEKVQSGIIIAGSDRDPLVRGEVVSVGGEVTNVGAGYRVLFNKYSAPKFTEDGVEYYIVNIDSIFARVG